MPSTNCSDGSANTGVGDLRPLILNKRSSANLGELMGTPKIEESGYPMKKNTGVV